MENKNHVVIVGICTLVIGLIIGISINGPKQNKTIPMASTNGTSHMMPDGTMMGETNGSDMASMMSNMNANLQGKTGDAFDQEFLAEMIVHHQGAIDMARLAQTNAKHQEIKDLATAIISAQTKEIEQMKQWQKAWYKK